MRQLSKITSDNDNRFLEMVSDKSTSHDRKQVAVVRVQQKVNLWLIDPNSRYKLLFDMISLLFITYDIIDVKLFTRYPCNYRSTTRSAQSLPPCCSRSSLLTTSWTYCRTSIPLIRTSRVSFRTGNSSPRTTARTGSGST